MFETIICLISTVAARNGRLVSMNDVFRRLRFALSGLRDLRASYRLPYNPGEVDAHVNDKGTLPRGGPAQTAPPKLTPRAAPRRPPPRPRPTPPPPPPADVVPLGGGPPAP